LAFFEVVLPGTRGRRRRRKTVKAATRDEAPALFRQFRTAVTRNRSTKPELFSDYVGRFWPLMKMRLGIKAAAYESDAVEKTLVPFFGSYLASQGVSLQVIARALGHASVTMSERYARPSQESLQEIKRALDSCRRADQGF